MDETADTTEAAEETPALETADTTSDEKPPWGDDFDPQKAWDTIQTQRASEKELKERAKRADELEAELQDEQKLLDRLRERGYEVDDDEDPALEDEDGEFRDPRVDELIAAREREQAEALVSDIQGHVKELAGKQSLELTDRQLRSLTREALDAGADPDATERLFGEFVEELKEYDKRAIERYRKSKNTTVPPGGGREATDESNRLDIDDDSERHRRMAERLRMARE